TSGQERSSPAGGPTSTTSCPRPRRSSATASVSAVRSSEPSAILTVFLPAWAPAPRLLRSVGPLPPTRPSPPSRPRPSPPAPPPPGPSGAWAPRPPPGRPRMVVPRVRLPAVAEPKILSVVLAGGEGKRLSPLTADRAKPAVPFGGHYRIVDFALSNLANAGYLKIVVLTQYKSHSLDLHITRTWRLSTLLGSYVTPVPAQMRRGPRWL